MKKIFKHSQKDNPLYKFEPQEFEKEILLHVANSESDKISTKAKILLELLTEESRGNISKMYGVSGSTVTYTVKQWLSIDFDSVNSLEEKITLAKNTLQKPTRPKILNEKEIQAIAEIGKDIENEGYKSRLSLSQEVAKEAKLKGLPDVSIRTIGRILEKSY